MFEVFFGMRGYRLIQGVREGILYGRFSSFAECVITHGLPS